MNFILTTKEELSSLLDSVFKKVLSEYDLMGPAEPKPETEYLDIEEACELLKLARPTMYTLTSKSKIPHFKRGKKLYFRRSELFEWIENGRQNTIEQEKAKVAKYLAKNRKKK